MQIGITYGTFDVLHYGHINLLKRCKDLCDFLIVGLSTDDFNELKGKKSYLDFETRKNILSSISYVDMIIEEKSWEQKYDDVKKYKASKFFMGDDWKGKFDDIPCNVIYLPRTEIISSTIIKKGLINNNVQ